MRKAESVVSIYEKYESMMKDYVEGKEVNETTLAVLDTIITDSEHLVIEHFGEEAQKLITDAKIKGGARQVVELIEKFIIVSEGAIHG